MDMSEVAQLIFLIITSELDARLKVQSLGFSFKKHFYRHYQKCCRIGMLTPFVTLVFKFSLLIAIFYL